MKQELEEQIKARMVAKEEWLSKYACRSVKAIRIKKDDDDLRLSFFRDTDRILYSLSFVRYMDKTQVFMHHENDHISKRMTHVQMVSKIGRTIGRSLCLNEDLIEAASLGHDLGHPPFGHTGERFLNKISLKYNEGYFNHNVQSVRMLMELENNGLGRNLTVQVLDAILCHNGEVELEEYAPVKKTIEQFLEEYHNCYVDNEQSLKLRPMTLEGCVVRISDIIAYIGKDLEEAIMLGLVNEKDIPPQVVKVLGKNNRDIVNTIVLDIINNSYDKPYIKMSKKIYKAIFELKKFNYENIYAKTSQESELQELELKFNKLFEVLLHHVKEEKHTSKIFEFLSTMSDDYLKNTSDVRKVIDYIAGMTDDYFYKIYNLYCNDMELYI